MTEPRKKILILGKLPPPFFGPAITTHILLNSKLKEDFNLIHVDTQVNKNLQSVGNWNVKKIVDNISVYFNLVITLKRENPHLVLVPISQTTIGFLKDSIFILLASLFGQKILINFLGGEFKDFVQSCLPITRKYIRFVLSKAIGVIVLGHNLKHLFEDYFVPKNIYAIPNGANFNFPIKTDNKPNRIELIYIANLRKRKGIIEVLESIKKLKDTTSHSFHLTVIGSWQQDEIKEKGLSLIRDYQLPVTIYSGISNKEKLAHLSKAEIFIFPPNEPEGHPWVMVEALAAGLPVISTDQGAIIESVINGKNGFIVPSNSSEDIYKKLNLLLNDENLRKQMSLESISHYQNGFTEERMVHRYISCFQSLIP